MHLVTKFCSAFSILMFAWNVNVFSQISREAENIVLLTDSITIGKTFATSSQKAECSKYSKAYLEAIGFEKQMPVPDSVFIGKCFIKAGSFLEKAGDYRNAVENYKASTNYFNVYSTDYIEAATSIAGAYKKAYDKGDYISPPVESSKIAGKAFFNVSGIISRSGNSMVIEVKGGKMDGLYTGSKFSVFSSYNSDNTRGNEFLGSGELTRVGRFSSQAELTLDDTLNIDKLVIAGDRLESQTNMRQGEESDMLYKVSLYNISFLDNYSTTIFFPWEVLQNDDPALKKIIYNAMTYCVREMAEYTTEYQEIYSSGLFTGMNCSQAMTVTEPCDIDEFLNFVGSFPARYLGMEWKISETTATWIINSTYKGNPYPELVNWLQQMRNDGTLSSFISDRPGYFTIPGILEYYSSVTNLSKLALNDSALHLIDLFIDISDHVGNDSIKSVFHETKGNLLMNTGKPEQAITEFTRALQYDPANYNAIYFRAYQYGQLNNYGKAAEDYEFLTLKLPEFAAGWGGLGWYLILQGKIFDAELACSKAYALDSLNKSWTVNMGHICLFTGDTAKARFYYSKYLGLLVSESEFKEGLMADFDIFLKNNWQVKNVNWARDMVLSNYNNHYRNYLLADELYDKAVTDKDKKNYRGLIENMKLSLVYELKTESPHIGTIHNIYTWMGYGYQYEAIYDSAFYFYNLGLQMAEKDQKNDDNVKNDLDLISWMYKTEGNTVKANEYKVELQALTQKIEEQQKKKSLYFISVGIDSYNTISFNCASTDAINIAKSIQALSKQGYDTVLVVVLTNEQARRENIQKEFEKIVSLSNPYDAFIFYFAGYCNTGGTNNYLATAGFDVQAKKDDYMKNTISAFSLHTMLSGISARKQWLIFDASAQKFVNNLISIELSKNSSLSESDKSVFIICPSDTRIEKTDLGQGLLTSTIIDGLQGKAESTNNPDGVITVKEMDNYIFQTMSNPSLFLKCNSYSTGRDFPVAFLMNYENKKIAEPVVTVQASRGATLITTAENTETSTSTEKTDYALIFATDNYDEWKDLKNPVFDGKALASVLENEYGFKVELITDATRRTIQDKIISYKKRNYNPGDQLFIFFAGHGLYDEENMQEGYIVAKDSKLDDPYKDSYVPFSFLRDHTDGNCKHVLLVLDVCFGGTFSSRLNPMQRGNNDIYQMSDVNELRQKISGIKSRYYITSGNKEYVSDGTPGKHSPFASFLIDGLMQGSTNRSKYLTYDNLVTFIDQIKTSTPTHSFYGESEPGGNFIFEVNQKSGQGSLGEVKLTK